MRLNATVRGINKLRRRLAAIEKKQNKALYWSIKEEAFFLRGELKKDLQKQRPGNKKFQSLTYLSRGWKVRTGTRLRPNKRFSRMAGAVRYHVEKTASGNPVAHVGFTKKSPKAAFFRDIVTKHAKGFTTPVTPKMRRYLAHQGARRLGGMKGQKRQRHRDADFVGGNTPYFLKKSTTHFKTPAQPIIRPFWGKHRMRSIARIRSKFKRKMRGERT